jgi:S-formylglutathione hydrolase FrmB
MRRSRVRRRLCAALLGVVVVLTVLPAAAAAPAHGLVETGRTSLTPRLIELTFRTPSLANETKVRVLLPAGYAHSGRRYPVVYLLNGGAGSWRDWTEQGDAERATADVPAIVVMPDGGTGGNYTDWYGEDGSGQRPLWETYHLRELLPWVDRSFRTVPDRSQRAVAGMSMGGNGALHYAARHPDLFVAAASFSGAVDVFHPLIAPITETTGMADGAQPGAVFGPRLTEEVRWRGSNPVDLAANLKDTWVSLAFGNGAPGGPEGEQAPDLVERAVYESNVTLHDALAAAGVPHQYDDYGPGAHTWPYWKRELVDTLPQLLRVFAERRPSPSTFAYAAIEPAYTVHGWDVTLTRPALEWSRLRVVEGGFVLSGSGSAVVRTRRQFRPAARVTVTTVVDGVSRTTSLIADREGRLTVPVSLGAGNPHQQYTAPAVVTGTAVREARVTLTSASST